MIKRLYLFLKMTAGIALMTIPLVLSILVGKLKSLCD